MTNSDENKSSLKKKSQKSVLLSAYQKKKKNHLYVSYVPRINVQLFPTLTTTKILINTFTIMMQVEKELIKLIKV